MGGLFKRGSSEASTEVDPWENMPKWQKRFFKAQGKEGVALFKNAKEVADALGADPRQVLGPSGEEELALDQLMQAYAQSQGLGDYAGDALGSMDFEGGYTDEVVNTTLAGMERAAERERLAREGRNAAIGGTTNTRSAVGDAIAQQLTGMNMAEMEAKLRDEGYRFGIDKTLEEAGLADRFASSTLDRGLAGSGALGAIGEQFRGLEQEQLDATRGSEKDALSWLGGMFGASSGNVGPTGQVQTSQQPKPSGFSQLLATGATVAGAYLSDERTKENIRDFETGLDALKDVTPKTYDYKEGMPTHKKGRQAGLMAQELEHIPGAVEVGPDGYRRVDPYPVLATVVQAVKDLDKRTAKHS